VLHHTFFHEVVLGRVDVLVVANDGALVAVGLLLLLLGQVDVVLVLTLELDHASILEVHLVLHEQVLGSPAHDVRALDQLLAPLPVDRLLVLRVYHARLLLLDKVDHV
jgi:hypothetical protein